MVVSSELAGEVEWLVKGMIGALAMAWECVMVVWLASQVWVFHWPYLGLSSLASVVCDSGHGTYCGDGLQNLVQMVSVAGFGASLESCLLMKIEKLSTLTPVVGLALDVE